MKLHGEELMKISSNKEQLCSHEDNILLENELNREVKQYG